MKINLLLGCPILHCILLKGTFIPPALSDVKNRGILIALVYKRLCMVIMFLSIFGTFQRMP